MKTILRKIKWYLKQLLPLTYHSKYECGGNKKICIWKMFLGICYDIEEYSIV
jgi:hypothetical protein